MNSLTKLTLLLSLSSAVLLPSAPGLAAPAVYVANPVADAYVATGPTGNLSNNNYGGGGALVVAAPNLPQGEFQTVMEFDLAGAVAAFNAQYGAGQWTVQSVSLQLTASVHGNPIYNTAAPGAFAASLLANTGWVEGTGNASSPSSTGLTYNLLQGMINPAADQALGTFGYDGSTSGTGVYPLVLGSALDADILAGGQATLRLYAADTAVSYLFNSRAATPTSTEPELIITATPEPGFLPLAGTAAFVVWGRIRRRRLDR